MADPAWIEARMPVWIALSGLFLDTELDDGYRRRIAAAVAGAGLDAAAAEAILRDEVLPAFASNLLQVAGEWAGWSDADVRSIMLASLPGLGRPSLGRWIKRRLLWNDLRREWGGIAVLIP